MKKLMFAAAIAAVGSAFAIESSNIVGYAPTSNEGAKAPIVGGQFFTVGGGETFDLQKLSVPGTKEWDDGEWLCTYLNPGIEYIRVLNTTSLATTHRYTYISEEFIIDNIGELYATPAADLEEALKPYKWAIGWWKYPLTGNAPDYVSIIENDEKESEYYIGTAVNIKNGTSFIGSFASGATRDLVSNGEVKIATFGYSTAGAKAPLFGNQLPVSIDLQDMAVPGTKEWNDGEWSCTYLNPGIEYIRVLNTTSLATTHRYTYISEEFIIDNIGELYATPEKDLEEALKPYKWAIGWWKYPLTGNAPDYVSIIENDEKDSEYYLGTTKVPVAAGVGFIGSFASGADRQIYFPSAIDVPSKK